MAHGSARLNICYDCNQVTLCERFSANQKCPDCGKETETATKSEIKAVYCIGIFDSIGANFNKWTEITEMKRADLID